MSITWKMKITDRIIDFISTMVATSAFIIWGGEWILTDNSFFTGYKNWFICFIVYVFVIFISAILLRACWAYRVIEVGPMIILSNLLNKKENIKVEEIESFTSKAKIFYKLSLSNGCKYVVWGNREGVKELTMKLNVNNG